MELITQTSDGRIFEYVTAGVNPMHQLMTRASGAAALAGERGSAGLSPAEGPAVPAAPAGERGSGVQLCERDQRPKPLSSFILF